MAFVDNSSYRRSGFGVRRWTAVLLVAVLIGLASIAPVSGQDVYETVVVADGAQLVGKAVFNGEAPGPRRLLVTKDEEVCGFGYLERNEVAVGDGGGLAGVVVVIEGIRAGKAWSEPQARQVLDQKDCIFSPHLLVVSKGSEVDILNSDPVLHNVHAYELFDASSRTMFNLGQPPSERAIVQSIQPRIGNRVRLECDAHDFMQSWVYVADTPYWVVTRADGSFAIEDVPPGEYTITAWHPSLGVQQHTVSLGPGGAVELALEFTDP
jgi:plastocyanin